MNYLMSAIAAIMLAGVLVSCGQQPDQPLEVEPVPQRHRMYAMEHTTVREWRDDWGRVCTAIYLNGFTALDCDWPQRDGVE